MTIDTLTSRRRWAHAHTPAAPAAVSFPSPPARRLLLSRRRHQGAVHERADADADEPGAVVQGQQYGRYAVQYAQRGEEAGQRGQHARARGNERGGVPAVLARAQARERGQRLGGQRLGGLCAGTPGLVAMPTR